MSDHKMHRIWRNVDVVRCILDICELPVVLALGRTEKALFEATTDVLYAHLPDLSWLAGLFSEQDVAAPPRDLAVLREHRMERLAYYCCRVRSLQISESNPEDDDTDEEDTGDEEQLRELVAFCEDTMGFMFPELSALMIHATTPAWITEATNLAVPSLSSLRLRLSPKQPYEEEWESGAPAGTLTAYLQPILELGRLDELRIVGVAWAEAPEMFQEAQTFVQSICRSYPQVSALYLEGYPLSAVSLVSIGAMAGLNKLSVTLEDGTDISQMDLPRLSELYLSFTSLELCTTFLQQLRAPRLEDVSLNDSGKVLHSSTPLRLQLARAIAANGPSLRNLTLSRLGSEAPTPWIFHDLRALYSCSSVRQLVISVGAPVIVTNDDLAALSMAWRQLRWLVLGLPTGEYGQSVPQATLDGLTGLAQSCPYLEWVALPVALPTSESPLHPADADSSFNSHLRALHLHGATTWDPDASAARLHKLFPHLQAFKLNDHEQEENSTTGDAPLPVDKLRDYLVRYNNA